MTVGVFEVYSEDGSRCAIFLTEQEAKDQTVITPSQGAYSANVELSESEYDELKKQRYICCLQ